MYILAKNIIIKMQKSFYLLFILLFKLTNKLICMYSGLKK